MTARPFRAADRILSYYTFERLFGLIAQEQCKAAFRRRGGRASYPLWARRPRQSTARPSRIQSGTSDRNSEAALPTPCWPKRLSLVGSASHSQGGGFISFTGGPLTSISLTRCHKLYTRFIPVFSCQQSGRDLMFTR